MAQNVLAIAVTLSPLVMLALAVSLSPLSPAEKAEERKGFRHPCNYRRETGK